MKTNINISTENLIPFHVAVNDTELNGENVTRVIKNDRLYDFDINSFARIKNISFHNGTIDLDVRSGHLPDYDKRYAGAYIGLAFRISDNNQSFECFYVRPGAGTKERKDSKVGAQYLACPEYTFKYFRDRGITDYEKPVDIGMNEWIHLRMVIHDDKGQLFVNDMEKTIFNIEHLFHGKGEAGGIGLFVDIGAECWFRNLSIQSDD